MHDMMVRYFFSLSMCCYFFNCVIKNSVKGALIIASYKIDLCLGLGCDVRFIINFIPFSLCFNGKYLIFCFLQLKSIRLLKVLYKVSLLINIYAEKLYCEILKVNGFCCAFKLKPSRN